MRCPELRDAPWPVPNAPSRLTQLLSDTIHRVTPPYTPQDGLSALVRGTGNARRPYELVDGTVQVGGIAYRIVDGHRGRRIRHEGGPGEYRIGIFGGSVFGVGLRGDETLSVKLERELRDRGHRDVEVVNFGLPRCENVVAIAEHFRHITQGRRVRLHVAVFYIHPEFAFGLPGWMTATYVIGTPDRPTIAYRLEESRFNGLCFYLHPRPETYLPISHLLGPTRGLNALREVAIFPATAKLILLDDIYTGPTAAGVQTGFYKPNFARVQALCRELEWPTIDLRPINRAVAAALRLNAPCQLLVGGRQGRRDLVPIPGKRERIVRELARRTAPAR